MRLNQVLPLATLLAALPCAALAHPHIMVDAELNVVLAPDKQAIQTLRHIWRFDEMSSSMMLMDLDTNGDTALDQTELDEASKVMLQSMAVYNYFQIISVDGKDAAMSPPTNIDVKWTDNMLTVSFEAALKEPLRLAGKVDIGVYDPTFYVAIDFPEDDKLAVADLPPNCARSIIRPDPDEVIANNQQAMSEAFMNDPNVNAGMGKLFATKLELTCQANG